MPSQRSSTASEKRSTARRQNHLSGEKSSFESFIGGEHLVSHYIAQYLTVFRLVDNADALAQACKIDLGKGHFEANLMELDFCTNTCIYCCDNLDKWAKDEAAADIQLANKLLFPKIRKDPLGCVLIIGYVPSLS